MLVAACSERSIPSLEAALEGAKKLHFRIKWAIEAEGVLEGLKEEARLEPTLRSLAAKDPDTAYDQVRGERRVCVLLLAQ